MKAYRNHLQAGWNRLPGYSQMQKPTKKKKGWGRLRITLKIKEQTTVNAIKTCWLQSVTGCLGEITGPRTAEHLNKRQQNVFYEDINMLLNYRVTRITDCVQPPKVCIIFFYKRASKPCLSIKKKKWNHLSGRAKLLTINHNLHKSNSLQGETVFIYRNYSVIFPLPYFPTKYISLKCLLEQKPFW